MVAPDVDRLGRRLREERERRGITVRGLARDVGVSASMVSQIETGKSQPSVSTLYAITTALGITVEELFTPGPASSPPVDEPAAPEMPDLDTQAGLDTRVGLDTQVGLAGPAGAVGQVPGTVAPGPAMALAGLLPVSMPAPTAAETTEVPGSSGDGGDHPVWPRGPRLGPLVRPVQRRVLQLDSGVTWELLGDLPQHTVDFLLVTYQPGGTSSSRGGLMRHPGSEYGYLLSGELVLTLGFDEYVVKAGDSICFDSTTPHRYRNDGDVPAVGVWFVIERPR